MCMECIIYISCLTRCWSWSDGKGSLAFSAHCCWCLLTSLPVLPGATTASLLLIATAAVEAAEATADLKEAAAVKELLEVSMDLSNFLLPLWRYVGFSVVNFDTKSKRLTFRRQNICESLCINEIFSNRVSSIDMISKIWKKSTCIFLLFNSETKYLITFALYILSN